MKRASGFNMSAGGRLVPDGVPGQGFPRLAGAGPLLRPGSFVMTRPDKPPGAVASQKKAPSAASKALCFRVATVNPNSWSIGKEILQWFKHRAERGRAVLHVIALQEHRIAYKQPWCAVVRFAR